MVFFFSSRRRHTRWPRDWISDVCSSDLGAAVWSGTARSPSAVASAATSLLPTSAGPRRMASRERGEPPSRSEEHTSELQSRGHLVCRLLLEKKKKDKKGSTATHAARNTPLHR